jgi:hypothetical protein
MDNGDCADRRLDFAQLLVNPRGRRIDESPSVLSSLEGHSPEVSIVIAQIGLQIKMMIGKCLKIEAQIASTIPKLSLYQ